LDFTRFLDCFDLPACCIEFVTRKLCDRFFGGMIVSARETNSSFTPAPDLALAVNNLALILSAYA
jgi:hypothetical protein